MSNAELGHRRSSLGPALLVASLAISLAGFLIWGATPGSEKKNAEHLLASSPAAEFVSSQQPSHEPSPGWPKLLGPTGHSASSETGLDTDWPATGPPLVFSAPIGTGYSAPVVNDDGLVIFHRRANEEWLECFDPESGARQWVCKYPTRYKCQFRYSSGPYSTPVINGNQVYANSAEGTLRCLDFATGQILWKRDLSREYQVPQADWAVGSSPCVSGDRVIVNLGGVTEAGVIALDRHSGQTLWTATDYQASYATPVVAQVHGHEHVFVFGAEGCVSLDPADGRQRWFVKFGIGNRTGSANAVSPLVSGDLLLLTAGPGPGNLCLRILPDGNYEEVWRNRRAMDSQFNNQICVGGHVYGFTSKWNGRTSLVCLELQTGNVCWRWESDLMRGSGLAADGRLILLGEQGLLAALEATPQRAIVRSLTAEPLLDAPCYSAPALHRGLLYVRSEQRLLCLSLRNE